jgi:hypothetical protein
MPRRSRLRASDADREYVAERLRDAAAEGRLLAEELEHRLEAALSARTYGELSAVVSDLPRDPAVGRAARRIPLRLRPATAVALVLALPIALAIAAAAIIAVVALLVAWATAVSLAALFLGSRARALGPWAMGYRAARRRRTLTPWL